MLFGIRSISLLGVLFSFLLLVSSFGLLGLDGVHPHVASFLLARGMVLLEGDNKVLADGSRLLPVIVLDGYLHLHKLAGQVRRELVAFGGGHPDVGPLARVALALRGSGGLGLDGLQLGLGGPDGLFKESAVHILAFLGTGEALLHHALAQRLHLVDMSTPPLAGGHGVPSV